MVSDTINYPVGRLTVSGGLAGFPWDGRTPKELLERADKMALHPNAQARTRSASAPVPRRMATTTVGIEHAVSQVSTVISIAPTAR